MIAGLYNLNPATACYISVLLAMAGFAPDYFNKATPTGHDKHRRSLQQ